MSTRTANIDVLSVIARGTNVPLPNNLVFYALLCGMCKMRAERTLWLALVTLLLYRLHTAPLHKTVAITTGPAVAPPPTVAPMSVHILTTGERDISRLVGQLPHAQLFRGSIGYDDSCKRILKQKHARFAKRYYGTMNAIEAGKLGLWCSQLRFADMCQGLCMLIEDDAVLSDQDIAQLYTSTQRPWSTPILQLARYNTINVWNGSRTAVLFEAVQQGIKNPADVTFSSLKMYTNRGPIGTIADPTHSAKHSLIRSSAGKRLLKLASLNEELKT